MFTDVVKVKVAAGKGGDGSVSFHRTRSNPKGGPDGGDGGRGGNIVLRASHNTNTLAKYRASKLWQAEAGTNGTANKKRGKAGADIELQVAPGTTVYDGETLVADLEKDGDEAIVALGGRGGFGNAHFISSVRQSPKMAELGEPGEEKELRFELKLVADVGLVGLPNAGKSTLLSIVSNAKPEIANYPFTTLVPNLGVVDVDQTTFLMADIPGLIEGASQGKGLGDEFLRHVERTKVLLHLVDATAADPIADYLTIQKELKDYRVDLSGKPQLVVFTKTDGLPKPDLLTKITQFCKSTGVAKKNTFAISAVAKTGLDPLLRATVTMLKNIPVAKAEVEEMPVIRLDDSAEWDVHKKAGVFVVKGKEIEGFAARTNFAQYQAQQRLRHILERKGILRQIARLGGGPGSKIKINNQEFEW